MTELHDDELGADARALFQQAAQSGLGPSAVDRQRMRARLLTAIAAGTAGGAAAVAASKAKAGAGLLGAASSKLAMMGTVAVLAAGTAVLQTRSVPEPSHAVPMHAPAQASSAAVAEPSAPSIAAPTREELSTRPSASTTIAPETPSAASPQPSRPPSHGKATKVQTAPAGASAPMPAASTRAPRAKPRAARPAPASGNAETAREGAAADAPVEPAVPTEVAAPESSLRAELALLGTAQARLRQGDHPGALAALAQHARSFPSGALREERLSAQAIALCRSGRKDDGRAIAERLRLAAPRSPLLASVARDCE